MKFKNTLGLVFLTSLLASTQVLSADRIRASYAALNASQSPLWVAREQGIYAKHGLEVDLLYLGGGSLNVQAIVAGSVQFGAGGAAAIAARLNGLKLLIVANPVPFVAHDLIARPEIKAISDLKGKIGGVARLGSSGEQAFRYLFLKEGLNLADLKLIQAGSDQGKLAALQSGRVDYTSVGAAASQQAKAQGFRVLAGARQLAIPFPWVSVVASESFLTSSPEVSYRYLKAMTEAIWFIKRNRRETERVIGKYMKVKDPQLLSAEYELNSALMSDLPYPSIEGVRLTLEDLAKPGGEASRDPKEFIETSLVERLKRERFLETLGK